LNKFPPQRRGLILEAIAGRKDDESRKAALTIAVAVKEPEVMRVSAMNALGTLDIPEAVPALLAGAADNGGQGPVADAAFRSLVFMKNKDADAAIAKAMTSAGNKIDSAMIRIAKERRTAAAAPQLWSIVKTADSPLRGDAIDALGETATLKDLSEVAKLMGTAKDDNERNRITIALNSIAARMPQQECFDTVVAIFNEGGSVPVRQAMIDLMKTIGGQAAVAKVTEIALGNNPQMADKATQVLGQWDSPDTMAEIADAMLKVAKQSREERFQIRGVRGYIRLARQFDYPEDQRIAMMKTAFDAATRTEDKNLIFDIFVRYPSLKMVEAAMSYASDETYRESACSAAVATAARLQGRQSQAAKIMEDVIKLTKNAETKSKAEAVRDKLAGVNEGVEIVKAVYGAGNQTADVTAKVRDFSGGSTILEIGTYNDAFGDAAPQVVKTLKITYKIKGGPEKTVEFAENAPINLAK
jgi:HEAT repeat protein